MEILFIAPLPPPITGNSLPVKVMYDELIPENNINIINLSKNSFAAGADSFSRVLQILKIFRQVWLFRKGHDLIYFTISESFAGNLKDIFIYFILRKTAKNTIIHMLGGAGMKIILGKKRGLQYKLNRYFIKNLGGVIVEGQTQADFFSEVISKNKIYVIPNFAEDFLFTTETQIEENFSDLKILRVLFISNLIYGKGHNEIVDAYKQLSQETKSKFQVDFAGRFESDVEKDEFMAKIGGLEGVTYHGVVSGEAKKNLYTKAHVFCLPTYYPYEGQPFCILESYATGCVLITTDHSGIKNVFSDCINGFQVEKQSIESLRLRFEQLVINSNGLLSIAKFNLKTATEKYRTSIYKEAVKRAFEAVSIN